MTVKLNVLLQSVLTLFQVANVYTQQFPKAQPFVAAGLTVTQALLALAAHYVNPDGTPASEAYKAPITQ